MNRRKSATDTLATGSTFAGHEIVRMIGEGGMGEVYLAKHPRLPRQVALKVLRRHFADNAEYQRRFIRESKLGSLLEHPAIVHIYDRGECDGRMWIAMQHIDGLDSLRLMREHDRPLTTALAAMTVRTVASALDYAHAQGVLHRDVKPANVLIRNPHSAQPGIYIADFGVAKRMAGDSRITSVDSVIGSVEYAAPERIRDDEVDGRADQYSLGCTAFHLLTGELPFAHEKVTDVVAGHLKMPRPAASRLNTDLSPSVDAVLKRAMATVPAERYLTCSDFAEELSAALGVSWTQFSAPGEPPRRRKAVGSESSSSGPAWPDVPRTGASAWQPDPSLSHRESAVGEPLPAGRGRPAGNRPFSSQPGIPNPGPSPRPSADVGTGRTPAPPFDQRRARAGSRDIDAPVSSLREIRAETQVIKPATPGSAPAPPQRRTRIIADPTPTESFDDSDTVPTVVRDDDVQPVNWELFVSVLVIVCLLSVLVTVAVMN